MRGDMNFVRDCTNFIREYTNFVRWSRLNHLHPMAKNVFSIGIEVVP